MIYPDDKQHIMTIIAKRDANGKRSAAPMKQEIVKDEDGEMDGRHAAAQDVIAAMHEKSPEKLMQALSNFVDMHHAMSAEPEVEE